MGLQEYQQKRKFDKTPEPEGESEKKKGENRFVVHQHFAKEAGLHHDFRLEMEEALKSWAVPKRVPEKPGIKRLAIMTEDHPLSYINFQGEIPEGQYGAGKVEIFDEGKYELIEKTKDKIIFELKGEKLKGKYNLLRFRKPKQWLLFKSE